MWTVAARVFDMLPSLQILFKFSKLRSAVQGQDWKWSLGIFVVGVNDVISDFSTLSLIPIKNPFFLFWVSLTSLLCSFVFCLGASFYSQIDLTWPLRALVFLSGLARRASPRPSKCWSSDVLQTYFGMLRSSFSTFSE